MSNAKQEHTPGPWHDDGYRLYAPTEDSDKRNGRVIVEYKHVPDFNYADAALIASAPELLEALERIEAGEGAPDIDVSGEYRIGLHCGVEDRDCRDRYEGADYGYAQGVEAALEWVKGEVKAAIKKARREA